MQDPTQITQSIPFTAWEQAAMLALVIVLIIVLFGGFTRMQEKWQRFIAEQNDKWQNWMERNEARTSAALEKMAYAIDKLDGRLEEHDNKVMERLPHSPMLKQRSNKRDG